MRCETDHGAWIFGTDGRISIGPAFYRATEARLFKGQKEVEVQRRSLLAHGFEYEISEVARCLRAGLLESPLMPHEHSVEVLRVCDELRRQVGVVFPFE